MSNLRSPRCQAGLSFLPSHPLRYRSESCSKHPIIDDLDFSQDSSFPAFGPGDCLCRPQEKGVFVHSKHDPWIFFPQVNLATICGPTLYTFFNSAPVEAAPFGINQNSVHSLRDVTILHEDKISSLHVLDPHDADSRTCEYEGFATIDEDIDQSCDSWSTKEQASFMRHVVNASSEQIKTNQTTNMLANCIKQMQEPELRGESSSRFLSVRSRIIYIFYIRVG
jgi:hypothetical protein